VRKIFTYILLCLFALMMSLAMVSCSAFRKAPEKKLAELVQANPQLIGDTVVKTVTDTITIERVSFEKHFVQVPDSARDKYLIDSLLTKLQGTLSNAQNDALSSGLRSLLASRPAFRDTLTVNQSGVTVRFWQTRSGQFQMAVVREEIKTPYIKEETVMSVQPVKPLKWYQEWSVIGLIGCVLLILILANRRR
jgi:hypothetical protein